ncbi:TraB/GumN family protein [uncultured Sphingobacterium sp.]|uniref:TraB/GumN family protein n=1 Tax=uncultured Sphingobacterium sp. TaxID=182688 RepID=UPI00374835E0
MSFIKDVCYEQSKVNRILNINWTTIIPNLIKDQGCFIAVGAKHLSREKGLISLLRAKGYSLIVIDFIYGLGLHLLVSFIAVLMKI